MKPTPQRGVCANCRELNPYTNINCSRCQARLAWAFLIDGKDDAEFETPLARFARGLFDGDEPQAGRNIHCRFCEQVMRADQKICPHCYKWLAAPNLSHEEWTLVDEDAPEIQRLIRLHNQNTGSNLPVKPDR